MIGRSFLDKALESDVCGVFCNRSNAGKKGRFVFFLCRLTISIILNNRRQAKLQVSVRQSGTKPQAGIH